MADFKETTIDQINGVVSVGNSTAVPLGSGEVFTGEAEDISNFAMIYVNVYTNRASAANGLEMQQSTDGVNWDFGDRVKIIAGTSKTFSIQAAVQYFRIIYTNGGVPQQDFRLQVVYKHVYGKPSSHLIGDPISVEDDTELVSAVITGEDSDGVFRNVGKTVDGALKISNESDGLAISEGKVTGRSTRHTFGLAPDFDENDGVVTIWDGANNDDIESPQYIYSTTAAIDSLSSSSAADNGREVTVSGLDANWEEVEQTVTCTGQTRVALPTPLIRCNKAYNSGIDANAIDFVGQIYIYENTALTAGVPDDTTLVRGIITIGRNKTLMAVYTIPVGKTAYLRNWFASSAGGNKDAVSEITFFARSKGGVFLAEHGVAITSLGTSSVHFYYPDPPSAEGGTDVEIRATTDQTATAVSAGFDLILIDD